LLNCACAIQPLIQPLGLRTGLDKTFAVQKRRVQGLIQPDLGCDMAGLVVECPK
jgi:hypothetical protein